MVQDCARESNQAQATISVCTEYGKLPDGSPDCHDCNKWEKFQRFLYDMANVSGIDIEASVLDQRMRSVGLASIARHVCDKGLVRNKTIDEMIPPQCLTQKRDLASVMNNEQCPFNSIDEDRKQSFLSKVRRFKSKMKESHELVGKAERFCSVAKLGQAAVTLQQNGAVYDSREHSLLRTTNQPTICCCQSGNDLGECYNFNGTNSCMAQVSANSYEYLYKNGGCTSDINYRNTLSGRHLDSSREDVSQNVAGRTLGLIEEVFKKIPRYKGKITQCQFVDGQAEEQCTEVSVKEDIERNPHFYLATCQKYIDELKNEMIKKNRKFREYLEENSELASIALSGFEGLGKNTDGSNRRRLSRLPFDVKKKGEEKIRKRKRKLDRYANESFEESENLKIIEHGEKTSEQLKLFCTSDPSNGGLETEELFSILPLMDITIAHIPNFYERQLYSVFRGCINRVMREANVAEFWEDIGYGVSCISLSVAYPPTAGALCEVGAVSQAWDDYNQSERQDEMFEAINGSPVPGASSVAPGDFGAIDVAFAVLPLAGALGGGILRTGRALVSAERLRESATSVRRLLGQRDVATIRHNTMFSDTKLQKELDDLVTDGLLNQRALEQLDQADVLADIGNGASAGKVTKMKLEINGRNQDVVIKSADSVGDVASGCRSLAVEMVHMTTLAQAGLGPAAHGVTRLPNGKCALVMGSAGSIQGRIPVPNNPVSRMFNPELSRKLNDSSVKEFRDKMLSLEEKGYALNGDYEFMVDSKGRIQVIDSMVTKIDPDSGYEAWRASGNSDTITMERSLCMICTSCSASVCPGR